MKDYNDILTSANSLQLPFESIEIDKGRLEQVENQLVSLTGIMGLFVCVQGEINILIDNNTYTIRRGDMYWLFPSLFAKSMYISDDIRIYCMKVEYEFVAHIIGNIDIPTQLFFRTHPCTTLKENRFIALCDMFRNLNDRINEESGKELQGLQRIVIREIVINAGTTIIYEAINYHLCSEHTLPISDTTANRLVQQFMTNVFSDFRNHRDVNYYAERLYITPGYLTHIVKHQTGKSASLWIIENVITESKILLKQTGMSIKEIAIRLNFSNQSFFGKYFKQYVGMSPKDFRNAERRKG